MSLLFPSTGDAYVLGCLVNSVTPSNLVVHLYSNNYTPVKASALGNFTESAITGYSAISLTGANFTITAPDDSNDATATYNTSITFTFTASGSVYGYYVTNTAGTTLVYAEQFATVKSYDSGGGSLSFAPTIQAN